MQHRVLALLALAACGDDGGTASDARRSDSTEADSDAPIDAKPPNDRHLGLIQALSLNGNSGPISVGFYDTPGGAPGCASTYVGACSLSVCDPNTSGIVAVSAGTLTLTIGSSSPIMLSPTGTQYPSASGPVIPPGTSATAAGAGDTVPAFTSGTVVMPEVLQVNTPASATSADRTQPLTFSWTVPVTTTNVYVNLSQQATGGPYPASFLRTVRCYIDSTTGSLAIPTELLGQFEAGQAVATAAAISSDTQTVGDYDVTVRLLALDKSRTLTLL